MSIDDFMRPRLIGRRFEEHAVPLEMLGELVALEEMVIEVAKWKFLQAHPMRKRSPRGFTQGVCLNLMAVESGSARLLIGLSIATNTLFPPENQAYFEQARDAIVSAIGAAEQNDKITDHLPEQALAYFDRFGRSLREDEAIEFNPAGAQARAVRLTRETRRKLVLTPASVQELTEETTLRGVIPEADQGNMTFQVQLRDGRKIRAPMTSPHSEMVIEAFNGYKSGVRVLLQGVGRFDRQGRLLRLDSIEYVSVLDPLDIPARLDEFHDLKDGWLEGHGKAPTVGALGWLADTFERHYPDDILLPYLYPTEEGGIRAEWTLGQDEASLDINLDNHSAAWHRINLQTNDEESRNLNLDAPDEWAWLVERIGALEGVPT